MSTHNGIRLVSTGRKKDLLGAVEEGVEYAETFKHLGVGELFIKGNARWIHARSVVCKGKRHVLHSK